MNADQPNYLNNNQFVDTMYLNVLDRLGDPGGLITWNNALQGSFTRADVLLEFARSPENIANNIEALGAIYEVTDGYWLI